MTERSFSLIKALVRSQIRKINEGIEFDKGTIEFIEAKRELSKIINDDLTRYNAEILKVKDAIATREAMIAKLNELLEDNKSV